MYVCDEDFFAPSLVSCQSFSANYYDDVDRFVFICTDSDSFLKRAQQYCADSGINVRVKKMDIRVAKDFPLLGHLHSAAYGRLFLQNYLEPSYARVLYLDVDTLSGSIDVDFDADLSGKVLGAVQDIGVVATGNAAQLLHQVPEEGAKYFNSGVLLIDWPLWCEQKIGNRCIEYLNSNLDVPYGDQCALNRVCIGNWIDLHPSWNTQTAFLADPHLVRTAKIFHFTGPEKPWQLDLWKHNFEFSKYYEKTLKGHAFDTTFRPLTVKSIIKRGIRCLRNKLGLKKKENWVAWVLQQYG